MAKDTVTKEVIIDVQTNAQDASIQIDNLTKRVEDNTKANQDATKSTKDLDKAQDELKGGTESLGKTLGDNALITQGLDKVTGGWYSTLKGGYESVKSLISGISSYASTQRTATTATVTSSTAMKGFRTALISTGVGALIVALGILVGYLINLAEATDEASEAQRLQEIQVKNLALAYSELNDEIDFNYNLSIEKAKQAGKSESDLNKLREDYTRQRIDNIQEEIDTLTKLNFSQDITTEQWESNNKRISELSKQRTKLYNDELIQQERDKTSSLLRTREQEKRFLEDSRVAKKVALEKEAIDRKEAERQLKEHLDRLDHLNTNYAISSREDLELQINSLEVARKKALEDNLVLEESYREKANERVNRYYDFEIAKIEEVKKEYRQYLEFFENTEAVDILKKALSTDSSGDLLERLKGTWKNVIALESKHFNELVKSIEDRNRIFKDSITTRKDISDASNKAELASLTAHALQMASLEHFKNRLILKETKASNEELEAEDKRYTREKETIFQRSSDRLKEIRDKEVAGQLMMADGISGILSGLSDASKEGTGIQKGLAIASVALDTGVSAISAFRGMVATFPGPQGMALGAVASAGIALQGLNQINQIKKIKTDGTETGGSASASMSATAVPNVSFVSSSENQIANTIADVAPEEQGPMRAYVVTSDINSAQELERNAIEGSSL